MQSDRIDERGRDSQSEPVTPDELTVAVDSVALRRLIEEVENKGDTTLAGYNRSYHRHNR